MLEIRPEVQAALSAGRPVVALESAFLSHGLPAPVAVETGLAMVAAVRAAGSVPAMIGVLEGRLVVGLDASEIETLAAGEGVAKVSRWDLGPALAARTPGGTTVSATLTAAAAAGIRLLATGGIGGVHRGAAADLDISADLAQIARAPVAVVCSGAKAVLDLGRTLQLLEALGVPVLGYRTDELPAFYWRRSGLSLRHRVNSPAAAAAAVAAHWSLERTGVVVAVPPPAAAALERRELEPLIADALRQAAARAVTGAAATPFLLDRLAAASGGRTVETNVALLLHNARVAAGVAVALVGPPPGKGELG